MTQTNKPNTTEQVRAIVEEFALKHIGIGDKTGSYIYHLMRSKEAFGLGTMSLEDFVEIEDGDEWLEETKDWLTTTLTQEHQKRDEMVEAERGRIRKVIEENMYDNPLGERAINRNEAFELVLQALTYPPTPLTNNKDV